MKRLQLVLTIVAGLLFVSTALIAQQIAPFASAETEARYRALLVELRCVKCQNQSLADSDAPVAQDLRSIIREQLDAGASDIQIKEYLVARYGDFVLYEPPIKSTTWLLWFGPAVIVLLGAMLVFRVVRQAGNAAATETDSAAGPEQESQ